MSDSIFWSSSDEDEWSEPPEKSPKRSKIHNLELAAPSPPVHLPGETVTAQALTATATATAQPMQMNRDSSVTIHRLSSVDKTGLEGTSERIRSVLESQKKGKFSENQAKVAG